MSLRVLCAFLLVASANAACDAAKFQEATNACSKTATKCATDAGADVGASCKCGDGTISCVKAASSDNGCDEEMKTMLDQQEKAYEKTKETLDCASASSGAVSWKGLSVASALLVLGAAFAQ